MNSMASSLAIELVDKGIRINTVMPGATKTPMLAEAYDGKTDEQIDYTLRQQILGMIEPEDVADIILFLLSDASRKITGRAIYADGGYLNLII